MKFIKNLFLVALVVAFGFSSTPTAFAVIPPEPDSGGRFFYAKGTKSSEDYRKRTQTGMYTYEDRYYGKNYLRAGNLYLKPDARYTREWDSNVFLSDVDEKSDWINKLNAGVDAELPLEGGRHLLSAGFQTESEWFNRFESQNHTDWSYQAAADLNFNKFSLRLYEQFDRTVSRAGTELTQRTERKENYLSGLLTVPFGKTFLELEVSDYIVRFDDPNQRIFNRNELTTYPRIGMNVGDRTQALFEMGYTHIFYQKAEDNAANVYSPSLGLRGFLGKSDRISYQVWAGYQFRHYYNDAKNDYNGFIGRGELMFRQSEFTELRAGISRRPIESVAVNESFYVQNEVNLRLRQRVFENFYANGMAYFQINDYPTGRTDFSWQPGLMLEYILPGQFASIFGEYRFTQRASDTQGLDYNRQIANFGVRLNV